MSTTPPDQQAALDSAVADALARIGGAPDAQAIREAVNAATGKKGPLAAVKSGLGKVADLEARKALGQAVNEAIARVEQAAAVRESVVKRAAFAGAIEADRVDMSELALRAGTRRGRMHLVTQATERLEDVFIGLGFRIAEGPEVETDFHNFEALNIPADHPARAMHDTFYFPDGRLLRTHTSPVQIRELRKGRLPLAMIMPGRVYRVDHDMTHSPMFHQVEGLVVDEQVSFSHLKSVLQGFLRAFFEKDLDMRLRPC
ncbi:MAG: phenylalanine--tRNA ligase subunit alpha, partial [Actinomycetota bacterium]